MNNWKEIWENKGKLKTNDLKELDGFEHTAINEKIVAERITSLLRIHENDKVLEIGCGAGMLAQYLNCEYVGVDYSRSLVAKHIEILHHSVLHCEAGNLIFKDKSFDTVFAYSVFQYFPDKEYTRKVINEMLRVARKNIFIGDLPTVSHDKSHLLYTKDEFPGFKITEGFYSTVRFNALLEL
jgi:ubiquinone/menaquinone biosynthesis C-methylase UbiE